MTAPISVWWSCPNSPPCPHAGILHDVGELGGKSVCCADGCVCSGANGYVGKLVVDHSQPPIDLSGTDVPIEENRYVALFSEGSIHGEPLVSSDSRGEPCRPVECQPVTEGSMSSVHVLTDLDADLGVEVWQRAPDGKWTYWALRPEGSLSAPPPGGAP